MLDFARQFCYNIPATLDTLPVFFDGCGITPYTLFCPPVGGVSRVAPDTTASTDGHFRARNMEGTMPRQTITLRVDYDDEGHVLSITDQRGIFVDRTRMREITQSIQAFYRGISDNELERYVDASTARWQARQDQKRTGDKPGYVYLFESYDGFIKIGQSKNPNERLKGINMPYRPRLIHKIRTSDMDATERYLHQRYAKKRCDGEWFSLSGEDLLWLMSRSTIDVDDSMPVEIVQVGHAIGRPQ